MRGGRRRRRRDRINPRAVLRWTRPLHRQYGDPNAMRMLGVTAVRRAMERAEAAETEPTVTQVDGRQCRHRYEDGQCLCPKGECWLSEQEAALRQGFQPEPYMVWLEAKTAIHREAAAHDLLARGTYVRHLTKEGRRRRRDRRVLSVASATQYVHAVIYNLLRFRDPGWFYSVDFTDRDILLIRDVWLSYLGQLRRLAGDEADVLRDKREGHGRTVFRRDIFSIVREVPVTGGVVPGLHPGCLIREDPNEPNCEKRVERKEAREEARQRGREDEAEYEAAKKRVRNRRDSELAAERKAKRKSSEQLQRAPKHTHTFL